jgi:hypothetical protein
VTAARLLAAASFALLALSGCLHREPQEWTVQRPIHQLRAAPESFEERVSVTLFDDQVIPYVDKMVKEGWGVLEHHPAAEPGTFIDDPVKPKVIVIFQRYKTKP